MKRIDTKANDLAVEQLRSSRGILGFTQKELAAIVGLKSSQQIADYETYRATVPAGLIIQVQRMIANRKKKSAKARTDRRKGDRRKGQEAET